MSGNADKNQPSIGRDISHKAEIIDIVEADLTLAFKCNYLFQDGPSLVVNLGCEFSLSGAQPMNSWGRVWFAEATREEIRLFPIAGSLNDFKKLGWVVSGPQKASQEQEKL